MKNLLKTLMCVVITVMVMTQTVICEEVAVNRYPSDYSSANVAQESRFPEQKRAYYILIDNSTAMGSLDVICSELAYAATVAENTDIKIFPLAGNIPAFKLTPDKASINSMYKAFSKLETSLTTEEMITAVANELLVLGDGYVKNLVIYTNGDTAYPGFTKDYLTNIANSNQGIKFYVYRSSGNSILDNNYDSIIHTYEVANVNIGFYGNSSRNFGTQVFNDYDYIKMPYDHYNYNRETGLLTIEKGKADANILVCAEADKNDLLYIGGYMTTDTNYEKYKAKDKITGVSLAYNYTNTTRNYTPKNAAQCLFTIDNAQFDIIQNSFVIPVKNADSVSVYYRAKAGYGISTTKTVYNKKYDDAVVNTFAPEDSLEKSGAKPSLLENSDIFGTSSSPFEEESGNPVVNILKSILAAIIGFIALIFRLFKIALLIFIVLMIVIPKLRNTIYAMVLSTRFGPTVEKVVTFVMKKVSSIAKSTAYYSRKISGRVRAGDEYAFISFCSKDMIMQGNRIEEIIRRLESLGISCWISKNNIAPGKEYSDIIPSAVRDSRVFLLFVSPDSINSKDVRTEFLLAKDYNKEIIPIQIKDFDLFKSNDNWTYNLKIYQIEKVFSNSGEAMDNIISYIKGFFKQPKQPKQPKQSKQQKETNKE